MIRDELWKTDVNRLLESTGIVANIERYAINDGNGVRTTIFMKGCGLRCRWCCNPETQSFHPEMSFFPDKCIGCMNCVRQCTCGALKEDLTAKREICMDCFKRENAFSCTEKCYVNCRKVTGEKMSVGQVYDIVKRDIPFYESSGGGVTLSGGEPMAQPEFAYALIRTLTERWISMGMETCGYADSEDYEKVLPYLDTIFMDIKHIDPDKHREWTGQRNEKILENIKYVDKLAGVYDNKLFIRVPVIPGFNDRPEEISEIARFVSGCGNVTGMELLPYHKLGRGKYYSLGRKYPLEDMIPPTAERMEELIAIVAGCDIPVYKF